ncbi:hypothetical protein J6590_035129 [Homalodisca vitripennis]|nr:hypothetical protein J6590_035129 [Homalodisca vitripennis]
MNEATKVKNCPRVKPHTTEYLHYLTQCCRSPTKLQDTYNRPSNITSAVHYPSMFPIDIDAHRVGKYCRIRIQSQVNMFISEEEICINSAL